MWIWFGLRGSTSQWWFGHQSDASDADADNLIIHYKKNNHTQYEYSIYLQPSLWSLYSRRVSWVLCMCTIWWCVSELHSLFCFELSVYSMIIIIEGCKILSFPQQCYTGGKMGKACPTGVFHLLTERRCWNLYTLQLHSVFAVLLDYSEITSLDVKYKMS